MLEQIALLQHSGIWICVYPNTFSLKILIACGKHFDLCKGQNNLVHIFSKTDRDFVRHFLTNKFLLTFHEADIGGHQRFAQSHSDKLHPLRTYCPAFVQGLWNLTQIYKQSTFWNKFNFHYKFLPSKYLIAVEINDRHLL